MRYKLNVMKSTRLMISASTALVAIVWLINGLYCKVLGMVPRHEQIVTEILGSEHSEIFTKIIGVSEILMAVWIVMRIKPGFCALTQMVIVVLMNIIEFFTAPELLLFGRLNIVFAFIFIAFIYWSEFILREHAIQVSPRAFNKV